LKLDEKNDGIVGAGVVGPKNFVWVVTESGVGKRSPIDEYPTQGRAGGGVRTLKFPPGNNQFLAAGLIGRDKAELIALTNKRTAKRSRIASAEVLKRDYKGTPELVSLAKGESVAEVYLIAPRAESESS
jgi:DNA gyrase subunit A